MPFNLDEIERALDEADCLADDATVEAALDRMAEAITARLADRNRTEFYRLLQKHALTPGLFKADGAPGPTDASP